MQGWLMSTTWIIPSTFLFNASSVLGIVWWAWRIFKIFFGYDFITKDLNTLYPFPLFHSHVPVPDLHDCSLSILFFTVLLPTNLQDICHCPQVHVYVYLVLLLPPHKGEEEVYCCKLCSLGDFPITTSFKENWVILYGSNKFFFNLCQHIKPVHLLVSLELSSSGNLPWCHRHELREWYLCNRGRCHWSQGLLPVT